MYVCLNSRRDVCTDFKGSDMVSYFREASNEYTKSLIVQYYVIKPGGPIMHMLKYTHTFKLHTTKTTT